MTLSKYQKALITADDWGMSPGVNDGILTLAQKGIVRRVSCMANGRYLTHRIEELRNLTTVQTGLHFDLTFERPAKKILRFLLESFFTPRKTSALVQTEFRKQWSRLVTLGLKPTYLDGHHHIHLLPTVLSALLEEARFTGVMYIRTLCDPNLLLSTKFPIVIFSYLLRNRILVAGMETHPCWYPNLERMGILRFKNKLRSLRYPTEIILHPACKNDFAELRINDSYSEARLTEYRMLTEISH